MSSTEPYPEVNLDESGHESRPTQQQGPEWPKKIRTLTATEVNTLHAQVIDHLVQTLGVEVRT